MKEKNVAVLMTCYNRVETTLGCLRGLFAQKLPEGVILDVRLNDVVVLKEGAIILGEVI